MVPEVEEDGGVTWRWIYRNRWFLGMFALVVAGGVEMRLTVQSLADDGRGLRLDLVKLETVQHEHESKLVETKTIAGEVARRLESLEAGQKQLLEQTAANGALLTQLVSRPQR